MQHLKINAHLVPSIGRKDLLHSTCGKCLMPSKKQKRKTKEELDALPIPNYIVKKNHTRGAKHGKSQEQHDHFIANESTRHAKKRIFSSVLERFQKDESTEILSPPSNKQKRIAKYLDSLMLIDFSYFLFAVARKEQSAR